LEPPEAVRAREIALLDAGIKNSKLTTVAVAKAKELRDLAEALFKAGKHDQARDERHAALIQIGYRYEEPEPTRGSASGSVPVIRLVPKSAVPGAQPATTGCGGGDRWVAPTQ